MLNKKDNVLSSLDTVYLFMVLFLLVLIIIGHNIFDILYLGVVTFYYIRIKLHRRKK